MHKELVKDDCRNYSVGRDCDRNNVKKKINCSALLPFTDSNPISPLTASLLILKRAAKYNHVVFGWPKNMASPLTVYKMTNMSPTTHSQALPSLAKLLENISEVPNWQVAKRPNRLYSDLASIIMAEVFTMIQARTSWIISGVLHS